MTPIPELDRGALGVADLAYLEMPEDSSPAMRVEAAIRAYLWALENTQPHPLGTAYPSLNEYRAALAIRQSLTRWWRRSRT